MFSSSNLNHTDSKTQEFTLLNSSNQYQKHLQEIQNSYDRNTINSKPDSDGIISAFKLVTEEYAIFSETSEIITFDSESGPQKVIKLIPILSDAGIQIQGIRLNHDNSTLEMGFQNADLKYKAILIIEAIGL